MNGSAVTPSAAGVVDLGTVITAHQDISGKQNVLTTTSVTSGTPTTVIGFASDGSLVRGEFAVNPVQDLTSSNLITLSSANWSTLKSAHYYVCDNIDMTSFNPTKEFINIAASINSNSYTMKINKNAASKYAGLFFIAETVSNVEHLYEIAIFADTASNTVSLRCATVY